MGYSIGKNTMRKNVFQGRTLLSEIDLAKVELILELQVSTLEES